MTAALGRYLGAQLTTRISVQHALDTDYFNRIEALNYAIGHDDGQVGTGPGKRRRGAGGSQPHIQDADLHLSGAPGRAGRQCAAGAGAPTRPTSS